MIEQCSNTISISSYSNIPFIVMDTASQSYSFDFLVKAKRCKGKPCCTAIQTKTTEPHAMKN